jgi:hypothetical protein
MRLEDYRDWRKDQYRFQREQSHLELRIPLLTDRISHQLKKHPSSFSISVLLYFKDIPYENLKRRDWPEWYDREHAKNRIKSLQRSLASQERSMQLIQDNIIRQLNTEHLSEHDRHCLISAVSRLDSTATAFLSNYVLTLDKDNELKAPATRYCVRGKVQFDHGGRSPRTLVRMPKELAIRHFDDPLDYTEKLVETYTQTVQEYHKCDDFGIQHSVSHYDQDYLEGIFTHMLTKASYAFDAWKEIRYERYDDPAPDRGTLHLREGSAYA